MWLRELGQAGRMGNHLPRVVGLVASVTRGSAGNAWPVAVATKQKRAAHKAANSDWMERIARFGLATRGTLYFVVALLALQIAAGDHSEHADREGALQAVARQPLGRALVAILAFGLAAYALWRL